MTVLYGFLLGFFTALSCLLITIILLIKIRQKSKENPKNSIVNVGENVSAVLKNEGSKTNVIIN